VIQPLRRHGRLIFSLTLSLLIAVFAWLQRTELGAAVARAAAADPWLISAAALLVLFSYFISAQVFHVVLRALGLFLDPLRLWATAVTAIVLSQSLPAGAVASYAFLVSTLHRRGAQAGEAALLASIETISYAIAMLVMFSFSIAYLAEHGLTAGRGGLLAAVFGLLIVTLLLFLLSRPHSTLAAWAARLHLARRAPDGTLQLLPALERLLEELDRARALLRSRPRLVLLTVPIQLLALTGHSVALLLVLAALDVHVSLPVVLCAFGVALITSTFNVLPGGGGTVEAALIVVLSQLGAGIAAPAAALIFRLLNFWLLLPVAALAAYRLNHEPIRRTLHGRTLHGRPPQSRDAG
jgi:uncharacterized protein (TIRG00374 family)